MFKTQPILVLGTILAWAWMIRSIVIQLPTWGHAAGAYVGHAMGIE